MPTILLGRLQPSIIALTNAHETTSYNGAKTHPSIAVSRTFKSPRQKRHHHRDRCTTGTEVARKFPELRSRFTSQQTETETDYLIGILIPDATLPTATWDGIHAFYNEAPAIC